MEPTVYSTGFEPGTLNFWSLNDGEARRVAMNEVFGAYRAYFAVGKEPGQGNGAVYGLDGFGIMVGFSIEILATAAAANQ